MDDRMAQAAIKSARGLWNSFPIFLGVILLIGLADALIPESAYALLFRGDYLLDPLIGSALGSIMAGNPITSYIIGGELTAQGVSLVAVTAFLVSWVTVGIVQLPAESLILGRKFAIIRNATSFMFSIAVAAITVFLVGYL